MVGVSGRDERQSSLGAKSKMQSAVTNGADSRAHRILARLSTFAPCFSFFHADNSKS